MIGKIDKKRLLSMALMLFFVLIVFILYLFIVDKDVNENVAVSSKLAFQKSITSYIQKTKQSLEADAKNSKSSQLKYMNKEILFSLLANFMQNVSIKDIGKKKDGKFAIHRFYAEGYIDTPVKFYKLLDTIHKKGYPIALDFPLKFERIGNQIKTSFFLELYQEYQ
ncbi:hypothetical protein [Nitratiruptor sp. YY09-18]|uniref:hypothetical protein n=1 Tax=Nitratiruptor sp. YY09-18 TaxID=2724901 RepID=UPI001915CBF7|nr:hypothetical protein [Nitratiruptor sp. YY09-18]BCD68580.1 hypothetical protein NitYY0918_C1497 [Nitratiruptor sp. YY09-18]